jgi:hypothetical protein
VYRDIETPVFGKNGYQKPYLLQGLFGGIFASSILLENINERNFA